MIKTRNTVIGGTAGASASIQITDYESVEELKGPSKSAGVNTPFGSFDLVYDQRNQCHGIAIGVGPGVGGDFHVNETYTYDIGGPFKSLIGHLKGVYYCPQ